MTDARGATSRAPTAADSIHLIIAGSTKCATTSLYSYLSAHPDVCQARFKETRFFLDPTYPISLRRTYPPGTRYADLFSRPMAPVRLEATPDYLYSPGTAARIREEVSHPRLLFVLRHPIDRLVSWYGFAREIGALDPSIDLRGYVTAQLSGDAPAEQHYMALSHGRYSEYLRVYAESFSRTEVLVVLYEDLVRDPLGETRRVCQFAGLSSSFFDGYELMKRNTTRHSRSPKLHGAYRRFQAAVRTRVAALPLLRSGLRKVGGLVDVVYSAVNTAEPRQVVLPADLRAELEVYYRGESDRVMRVGGLDHRPWPDLDAGPPAAGLLASG